MVSKGGTWRSAHSFTHHKITDFKCTIHWVLVNLRCGAIITIVQFLKHVYFPKKIPCAYLQSFLIPTFNYKHLLIYFLFLRICLFWTFHINGIIQYVGFWIWLLSSCCSMYRYFIPSSCQIIFYCMDITFYLSIHPLVHNWVIFTF